MTHFQTAVMDIIMFFTLVSLCDVSVLTITPVFMLDTMPLHVSLHSFTLQTKSHWWKVYVRSLFKILAEQN